MTFDYLRITQAMDFINIPDIGNTCICACSDNGLEWYLIIKTEEGWTTVVEFGPLFCGESVITYFNFNTYQREYSDKKNSKVINDFINNAKREITQVLEIDKEEAIDKFNNIKDNLI